MRAWKKVESRQIYANPWIRVREDSVIRPDGRPGIYSVIEFKGGIGVVAIDDRDRICLVGQYRYAPATYSWEIPKGAFESFDSKEEPLLTAKRELEEETGLRGGTWAKLGKVHTLMGSTDDVVCLFVAYGLEAGTTRREGTEDIEMQYASLREFEQMVQGELITDATSIAAVYLANRHLRNARGKGLSSSS